MALEVLNRNEVQGDVEKWYLELTKEIRSDQKDTFLVRYLVF